MLSKVIYRFNTTSIKIPIVFLKNKEINPEIHIEQENTQNRKDSPEHQEQMKWYHNLKLQAVLQSYND